jgi:hypothetical protein
MRVWSINEQVYVDPNTKLRFEFTSENTESVARGEGPALHDEQLYFNVYNEANTKVIRMRARRNGLIDSSEVEGMEGVAAPATAQEEARAAILTDRPAPADHPAPAAHSAGHEPAAQDVQPPPPAETDWTGVNMSSQFSGDIE